jgi:hypothetical protein
MQALSIFGDNVSQKLSMNYVLYNLGIKVLESVDGRCNVVQSPHKRLGSSASDFVVNLGEATGN